MRNFIFLFVFILCSVTISAKNIFQNDSTTIPHNFFEFGYGTGMVNNRFTMAAGILNFGYKNAIVTARLCRSSGSEYRGYIFEDAFLLGYRFNFGKFFATTFSGGYSDLAFEKGYHSYFAVSADQFDKAGGFSFEAEAELKIPNGNKISPFSFSAIYYSTFNSMMNLNGFMVALKFCPERFGKHWYDKRENNFQLNE